MRIDEKVSFFLFTSVRNLNTSKCIFQQKGSSIFLDRSVEEMQHKGEGRSKRVEKLESKKVEIVSDVQSISFFEEFSMTIFFFLL
jgi:sucrose-6-phosphate hydrolase SacC (GH32 family)